VVINDIILKKKHLWKRNCHFLFANKPAVRISWQRMPCFSSYTDKGWRKSLHLYILDANIRLAIFSLL